ncbi:hypothetical protein C8R43DRAFT_1129328 [Mycena crocata]|nr:hypothetical protein C8R43DRAFT_1129328 [Mycena crocata]
MSNIIDPRFRPSRSGNAKFNNRTRIQRGTKTQSALSPPPFIERRKIETLFDVTMAGTLMTQAESKMDRFSEETSNPLDRLWWTGNTRMPGTWNTGENPPAVQSSAQLLASTSAVRVHQQSVILPKLDLSQLPPRRKKKERKASHGCQSKAAGTKRTALHGRGHTAPEGERIMPKVGCDAPGTSNMGISSDATDDRFPWLSPRTPTSAGRSPVLIYGALGSLPISQGHVYHAEDSTLPSCEENRSILKTPSLTPEVERGYTSGTTGSTAGQDQPSVNSHSPPRTPIDRRKQVYNKGDHDAPHTPTTVIEQETPSRLRSNSVTPRRKRSLATPYTQRPSPSPPKPKVDPPVNRAFYDFLATCRKLFPHKSTLSEKQISDLVEAAKSLRKIPTTQVFHKWLGDDRNEGLMVTKGLIVLMEAQTHCSTTWGPGFEDALKGHYQWPPTAIQNYTHMDDAQPNFWDKLESSTSVQKLREYCRRGEVVLEPAQIDRRLRTLLKAEKHLDNHEAWMKSLSKNTPPTELTSFMRSLRRLAAQVLPVETRRKYERKYSWMRPGDDTAPVFSASSALSAGNPESGNRINRFIRAHADDVPASTGLSPQGHSSTQGIDNNNKRHIPREPDGKLGLKRQKMDAHGPDSRVGLFPSSSAVLTLLQPQSQQTPIENQPTIYQGYEPSKMLAKAMSWTDASIPLFIPNISNLMTTTGRTGHPSERTNGTTLTMVGSTLLPDFRLTEFEPAQRTMDSIQELQKTQHKLDEDLAFQLGTFLVEVLQLRRRLDLREFYTICSEPAMVNSWLLAAWASGLTADTIITRGRFKLKEFDGEEDFDAYREYEKADRL